MLLYWVISVGMVSAFMGYLLGVLLDSGDTLTRRGIIAEFLVGVLFAIAGASILVMMWVMITN
jgi:hypothetical protein